MMMENNPNDSSNPDVLLNVYHIVFKEVTASGKVSDIFSKGENFRSVKPETAIQLFRIKYPTARFLTLYDVEALEELTPFRR